MSQRRRWLGGLTAVAALAVTYGVVRLAVYEPVGVKLEIGARLSLAGVTWGQLHTMIVGSGWQRVLLTLAPDQGGSYGGQRAVTMTPSDQPVIWVRQRGQFPGLSWYLDHGPNMLFDVMDELGCSFHRGAPGAQADPPPPRTTARQNLRNLAGGGGNGVFHLAAPAFPRRTGTFQCVVVPAWDGWTSGETAELARFTVPAPPTPPGTPLPPVEAYPIHRRIDDTELVVDGIGLARPGWAEYGTPPPGRDWRVPVLRYHTEARGRRGQEWQAVWITVTDATGNSRGGYLDGIGQDRFDGLCHFEPGWKCELELVRGASGDTRPDRVWKLRIPIPPRGASKSLGATYQHGGVTLELAAVNGFRDAWPAVTPPPTVTMTMPPESKLGLVALRILGDSRGGVARWALPEGASTGNPRIVCYPPDPGAPTRATELTFDLPVKAGTRWVDAELQRSQSKQVSFVARPPGHE